MGSLKSQLDARVEFLSSLIYDVHLLSQCDEGEARRDIETLTHRVSKEGFGFLSKALPKLGKALDQALETGVLDVPNGFRTERNTKRPVFLRGLFRRLFSEDGYLIEDGDGSPSLPTFEALRGLRQILYLFYKEEMEYEDHVVAKVLETFIDTDSSLFPEGKVLNSQLVLDASLLLERLFADFDPRDVGPGHGPGSVATGERGNEKFFFKRRYPQLHEYYPYYDYMTVGRGREVRDRIDWYKSLQLAEPTARVVLVPKDSRGPRLISMEPLEIQWIQQGLGVAIDRLVESHPLTRGWVNFTNQGINQNLALLSSSGRAFATIDMKDASDRVSLALVRSLFPDHLLEALEACRSTQTLLPDGRLVPLRKFAPMGSRVCFSIEALVFWSLATAALHLAAPGERQIPVYVYGDDIIVPTWGVDIVIEALESVQLIVNRSKSFSKGFFRESCGVDAWHGADVTPCRVKFFDSDRTQLSVLYPHLVSLVEGLYRRGYWRAMDWLGRRLQSLGFVTPVTAHVSGCPSVVVDGLTDALRENRRRGLKVRWNTKLQRYEVRAPSIKTAQLKSPIEGWQRLLRALSRTPAVREVPWQKSSNVLPVAASSTAPDVVPLVRATYLVQRWQPV